MQPRLKLVAALITAGLALAAAPAIASGLSAARPGSAAEAKSTATGVKPLFTGRFTPRLSWALPAAASRSRWSIQQTPNPGAPNGRLFFGTCTGASSCVAVGSYVRTSKVGVTLVERWNGEKWRVQRTPNPARERASILNGVSCSSRSACTAVGDALSASNKWTTLIERWDGSRWRIEPTPNPAGSRLSALFGVACPSSSSCTAVGFYINRAGIQLNLSERWNGKRWRIQPTPNPAGAQFGALSDVSCTAPSACIAVGFSNLGTLAERWNGHKWEIQPTPNPAQGGGGLIGVACISSSSCTAVGGSSAGSLAERWNGTSWRIQPTPNPRGLSGFFQGVDCSSPSACTAVGGGSNGSGTPVATLAERWNGHKWSIQHALSPSPTAGNYLSGVACPSSATCTAFGISRLSNFTGTPLTMVQTWSGHRWRLERTPNPGQIRGAGLFGVSCTSSSSCQAVGGTTAGTLAERWNGTRWAIEPTPNRAGAAVSGFNGVSCTSPSACTAVGAAFTTFNGNPVGTLAERWSGHKWSIQPTPTSKSPGYVLNAVSCASASACTAVGNTASGLLAERWNGTNWSTQQVPIPTGMHGGFLTGVSCNSASSCTAVGVGFDSSGNFAGTLAERWNGTTWSLQPTPTSKRAGYFLGAVSCTSASACTAVGSTNTKLLAERWNGTVWTVQPTPTPPAAVGQGPGFSGVSCPSRSACTAVAGAFPPTGPFTIAERWNGSHWRIQPTPNLPASDLDAQAVSCPTPATCTAVDGYTNNGVKLTLAERWNGRGGSSRPRATFQHQANATQARGNQQ